MGIFGKNRLFYRQFWPGYFFILLGLLWMLWDWFGLPARRNGVLFLLFFISGLLLLLSVKFGTRDRMWIRESGLFLLIGSFGYGAAALHLFSAVSDVWGFSLSVVLIRLYFRQPHLLLVYFLSVLVFLFSVSHFLAAQFEIKNNLNGALFLFGFGLSFLYLYILMPQQKEMHWTLIPGIVLTPLGLFLLSTWVSLPIIRIFYASELIFLGIWLILRARSAGEWSDAAVPRR